MQLSDQCHELPPQLLHIYGNGHQQPSIAALQLALKQIIGGFEHAYIVIDALDECTERRKILAWVIDLLQSGVDSLHLLLSSRREHDIEDRLATSIKGLVRVSLTGRPLNQDITMYIDSQLALLTRWDQRTRQLVRSTLSSGADGM